MRYVRLGKTDFEVSASPSGVVSWSYVSPIEVNPGADGILRALEDLPIERVAS